MLRYLVDLMGPDRIALGSDYPFPLGEARPGELIDSCGFPEETRARLLHGTALEWLDLPAGALRRIAVNEPFQPGRDFAVALDRGDPLGRFRDEFHIPEGDERRGRDLFRRQLAGAPPEANPAVRRRGAGEVGAARRQGAFLGGEPMDAVPRAPRRADGEAGGRLAPSEVVTMNSLTVNLHLMMASFYRPTRERHRILLEEHAFPSDDYARRVPGQRSTASTRPRRSCGSRPGTGKHSIDTADIAEVLEREGDSIALVLLPGVQYYTGQAFEIEAITRLAHEKGCVVGFDLAHAAGNLVLRLHDWNVDFAVWCTYKYLNSGPGSVGGCFVHERHGMRARSAAAGRLVGPRQGIALPDGARISADPRRGGMAALEPSDPLARGHSRFARRLHGSGGNGAAAGEIAPPHGLPRMAASAGNRRCGRDPHPRGSAPAGMPALASREVERLREERVFERLEASGVTCDWREPDVIRVAPVPALQPVRGGPPLRRDSSGRRCESIRLGRIAGSRPSSCPRTSASSLGVETP